jgi:hypothetical protein
MNRNAMTSAELLAATGVTERSSKQIPIEHRHLLITAVLECIPERKLRDVLVDKGCEVSIREVGTWMKNTREWLGLPRIGQGKPSASYLSKIEKWREANGNPTLDQIDAGWVPPFRRKEEKERAVSKLPSKLRAEFREFQEMIASFNGVREEDVQELLQKHLLKIKSKLSKLPAQKDISPPKEPPSEGNDSES